MQHRLFLVPARANLTPEQARRHWETRHVDVFLPTPGLRHYRQNRPVDTEWARGAGLCCSETWYADRGTERAAYTSPHYRDTVIPDEQAFLHRDAAWSAAIVGDQPPPGRDGPRVLWFGATPPPGPDWEELHLTRPVPPPGQGRAMHVANVDDLNAALDLTRDAPCVALVCHSLSWTPRWHTVNEREEP